MMTTPPSCVFNKKGPLAGYEMGMAHDLVWFLGTGRIELVPHNPR